MSHYTVNNAVQWRSLDRQWTDLDGRWTNPKHSDLCQPVVTVIYILCKCTFFVTLFVRYPDQISGKASQPGQMLLMAHYFGNPYY